MSKFNELVEKVVSIQVYDVDGAMGALKKKGVKAKVSKKYNDEIEVNLKDKAKLKAWMLSDDGGWDIETINDIYSEINEATFVSALTEILKEDDNKVISLLRLLLQNQNVD